MAQWVGIWLIAALFFSPIYSNAQTSFDATKIRFSGGLNAPVPTPVVYVPVPVAPTPVPVVPAPTPTPPGGFLDVSGAASTAASTSETCTPPLDYLRGRGGFSVFLNAIQAAGLTSKINSGSATQTLLSPTDGAFVALLASQGLRESQLLSQTDKLRKLIQNHLLVDQDVRASDFTVGRSFPTANTGQVLTVAGNAGSITVGADLPACKTLIQEINMVLVPSDILPLGPGGSSTPVPVPVPVPVPTPVPTPTRTPTTGGRASTTLDITKIDFSVGSGTGSTRVPGVTSMGRKFLKM